MSVVKTDPRGPQRAAWLDISRVLAMFGIIFIHMGGSYLTYQSRPECVPAIRAYFCVAGGMLAFFFMVSGYFCKSDMPAKKWARRITMLLVGFVAWNLLYTPGLNDEVTFGRIFGVGSADALCADYPLWYLRALIMMMLFLPMFRRCVWLYALIAFAFTLWGNNWHCSWVENIPAPEPFYVLMFALGSMFSNVPLSQLRRLFFYTTPIWALGCAVFYVDDLGMPLMHRVASAFLLASLGTLLAMIPKVGGLLAKWADATYLCYAVHAGALLAITMALHKFVPEACSSKWVYCLLPIVIYAASAIALRLMRVYTPWLLPWLAHEGRLPFLK